MHSCPHCRLPGIPSLQKLCSVFMLPTTCRLCSKRSFLDYHHGVRAMVVWVILTWVFIGIAIYQQMSIYLIGTFPALVFAIDRYMLKVPLQGVD